MNSINLTSILVAAFILLLGGYVYSAQPRNRLQTTYFLLSVALFGWLACLGFRIALPFELRELALNWTLIPVVLVPFLLYLVVRQVVGISENLSPFFRILNSLCIGFFLVVTVSCEAVEIREPAKFSYKATWKYHTLIMYSAVYILWSIGLMGKGITRSRGMNRVRSFLLLLGASIGLVGSILCVYVFPLLGIFVAQYSAIGLGISAVLWAVAILHYDAFEIKDKLLAGESVPFLTRYSNIPVMGLYSFLDPSEYRIKSLKQKAFLVHRVILQNHMLLLGTEWDDTLRAKIIAKRFGNYLK
ncbi:LIC10906 family membrane protein [Leptospira andrefontaineae]|uniref:Histidine kinase N-terminal 7TM region domain-containing protein n=1 Tax=Leptospira andrefontaineae TaxID=2484976 RepID=A0A4R9GX93_9LEPT|nr:histidine kinase N-terminal 7TM domain-containing protein [Leptospira andrefontaineae]TGK36254.1 hypothetical protein EHO65_18300 [Leptospira andrefontaineae]